MNKILKAEFIRFYRESKAYYPDTIVTVLTNIALFLLLRINDPSLNLPGYMLWMMSQSALAEASVSISMEKQLGTLQNLMIRSSSLLEIMVSRMIVWSCFGAAQALVFFLFTAPLIEVTAVSWSTLAIVFIAASLGMIGPGLVMASLTLLYTKTASFQSILSYLLLAVSGLVFTIPFWGNFTNPLSAGIFLLENGLSWMSVLPLAVASLVWLLIGIVVFRYVFKRAKAFAWTY